MPPPHIENFNLSKKIEFPSLPMPNLNNKQPQQQVYSYDINQQPIYAIKVHDMHLI